MENMQKKQNMGRRKIEIKKIESKSHLNVTFSKRRAGLFKKAGELSALTGSEIAVIVQSPAKKIHAFGSSSVDSIVDRYLVANSNLQTSDRGGAAAAEEAERIKKKYLEAIGELESEKERAKKVDGLGFWWDAKVDELGLTDLEKYIGALENLKKNVLARADELAMASTATPLKFYLPPIPAISDGFDCDSKFLYLEGTD